MNRQLSEAFVMSSTITTNWCFITQHRKYPGEKRSIAPSAVCCTSFRPSWRRNEPFLSKSIEEALQSEYSCRQHGELLQRHLSELRGRRIVASCATKCQQIAFHNDGIQPPAEYGLHVWRYQLRRSGLPENRLPDARLTTFHTPEPV